MKIKSLLLAFPVLCLACNDPSSPSDPASQLEASPLYARKVTGVNTLTVDFNYDEPCNILGEEYVRSTFNLSETTALEEGHAHNGCAFEWAGNKVLVSFGGSRPYQSVYLAEHDFDKMYQGKTDKPITPVAETQQPTLVISSEGNSPSAIVSDHSLSKKDSAQDNDHPNHGGISAATPSLTEHAVSKGNLEAVPNVGDKALWDPTTGTIHILFNNHIINVSVETKDKPEVRKERALSLAEVLMEKVIENEYTRRL